MIDTNWERFINRRDKAPYASGNMASQVSQYRREVLEDEVARGAFVERGNTGSSHFYDSLGKTGAGNVVSSKALAKYSTSTVPSTSAGGGAATGGGFRGSGGTVRQTPEVYSPLWLNSNLNLPRDRATINAWTRAFFALNPFVQNAITLHSTYPISKLNIKCKDESVRAFFESMIEDTDLMNICVQIAQEYWLLGEAFVYAELNERSAKWDRLIIQNPDYITIKHSVAAGEPILSLRPDEDLKRIVTSNKPSDIQQRQGLDRSIIEHVRRGENIPLSNFYASHIARRLNPYDTRGTGLVTSCFRNLMLFDKIRESKFAQADNMINPLTLIKVGSAEFRPSPADLEAYREVWECHDEETEVLTDQGFKKFDEVIAYQEVMDGTYNTSYITSAVPYAGIKIACFNPNNEQLEYHEPTAAHVYNYNGEMYHFSNDKIDIKVTPNHKMWVSEREYEYNGHRSKRKAKWGEWKKVEAQDIKLTDYSRFRSEVKWTGKEQEFVDVLGKQIPIELYLQFLGYLLSEGCLYTDSKSKFTVGISQAYYKFQKEMEECITKFAGYFDKNVVHSVREANKSKNQKKFWSGTIFGKELFFYFKSEISDSDGNVKAQFKRIPRWILDLNPRLLNLFLKALIEGDGSTYDNSNKKSKRFAYYSTSKQLADDVYEIVYKCGYVPTSFVRCSDKYIDGRRLPLHTVLWSTSSNGTYPLVYKTSRNSITKEKHELLAKTQYTGKVWCFTVPTGLFITRRNGKITVQSNSAQYDKDFKIFTHNDVTVERIGYNSGIIDVSTDIDKLTKELYIGLMVPQVLMDGGGDVTYANAGVTLDVLRQRYMQFREMLSSWLRKKIFAPISKINDFYEYRDGEKILIVPDIEWNHMSLFDAGDYIQILMQLVQGTAEAPAKISTQTLYRSLGLDWEDEVRKLRVESIQNAIYTKESQALEKMSLNELRTLGPDDTINAPIEGKLPGESDDSGEESGSDDSGLGFGLPGMGPTPSSTPPPPTPELPPPPPAPGPPESL